MQTSEIQFEIRKQPKRFKVKHNLEEYGLSIYSALDNWLARTGTHTVDSFCNYVKSKDPISIICNPVN